VVHAVVHMLRHVLRLHRIKLPLAGRQCLVHAQAHSTNKLVAHLATVVELQIVPADCTCMALVSS
jgi:hypothetical protein